MPILHTPPNHVRAVLFDMDGVLFDSMPGHARCWVQAGKTFGLHVTAEDVYMNEGRTGASTINLFARRDWGRAATAQEVECIYAEKCRLFNELPEAQKMPGAELVLRKVVAVGCTAAVVTGSGQASLLERLQTNFPRVFQAGHIVSSHDCKHGKPHPDPYLLGLKRAGVSAGEAIVVENAPLGVQAARSAGIFTVAVNTGPLANEELLRAGADAIFSSMQALATSLDDLLSSV